MRPSDEDIIRALHCINIAGGGTCKGQECPYHTVETLDEEYQKLYKSEYITSCADERIIADAAYALEAHRPHKWMTDRVKMSAEDIIRTKDIIISQYRRENTELREKLTAMGVNADV